MTEVTRAEEMIHGAQFVSVFEVVEQEAPGMATICSVWLLLIWISMASVHVNLCVYIELYIFLLPPCRYVWPGVY